jgi:hypothetical protein
MQHIAYLDFSDACKVKVHHDLSDLCTHAVPALVGAAPELSFGPLRTFSSYPKACRGTPGGQRNDFNRILERILPFQLA